MHKDIKDQPDGSAESKPSDNGRKSVEDLLTNPHEVIGSSISQAIQFTSNTILQSSPITNRKRSPSPTKNSTNNLNSSGGGGGGGSGGTGSSNSSSGGGGGGRGGGSCGTSSSRGNSPQNSPKPRPNSSSSSLSSSGVGIFTAGSSPSSSIQIEHNQRCSTPTSQASPTFASNSTSALPTTTAATSVHSGSPSNSSSLINAARREQSKSETHLSVQSTNDRHSSDNNEDLLSRSNDGTQFPIIDVVKSSSQDAIIEQRSHGKGSKVSERAKKKSWYSVLYPSYKSRSEDFKRLFKDVPDDERLVVDYSCALQRDILVHGRLYVSQNYLCFYANIFRWETSLSIKWKDVTAITKDKTARVIPNAISVCTISDKYFFTSFTTRDKAYLMLFRVWQNALMDKPMQPQEMWQWVHNCYGDELGLTSDDEDYIDPYEDKIDSDKHKTITNKKQSLSQQSLKSNPSIDSVSEDQSVNDYPSDGSMSLTSDPHTSDNKSISSGKQTKRGTLKATRQIDCLLSPIEQLPTDMSDSSDSEANKINFVNPAECNSMHEGRQLVHTILPINIENLFSLLFSKSKFLVEFHAARKTTDMIHGDWQMNEETGLKERVVTLTVALTQSVGPKSSAVTEIQVMRDCSQTGQLYSVDITSTNAGIPYAESFFVTMHYCLVRTVDDHTMFSVHAQVKYKKSVWGLVKGFIEKNTWAGLEDFYSALLRALQSDYCIPPAKAKSRRTRRGAALQQKIPVECDAIQRTKLTNTQNYVNQQRNINNDVHNNKNLLNKNEITNLNNINNNNKLNFKSNRNYEILSWCVIILLLLLIVVNISLYVKLYALETRTIEREQFPDFTLIKEPPKTHDEWLKLLQQQERLHTTEMLKWQKVLQTAIELLRKVSVVCEKIVQTTSTNNNSDFDINTIIKATINDRIKDEL